MSPLLAILLCALLFVMLGVVTREGDPGLAAHGEEDAPADEACGDCAHPCALPEIPHDRA